MTPHRVLIVDPIAAEGEEVLAKAADVVRSPNSSPETIRSLAREADGVITRSKLPDDLFVAAPRVRAVAIHGTGTDLVPLEDATARGVPVSNIPGGNAQSVAEYCVMAMLMLSRRIISITSALKGTTWDEARTLGAGTHEIAAMTVGIVGVGEIGTRLARACHHGFGMRVLGHQRRVDRLPAEALETKLDDLVAQSDFVVVTCPLTPETHHLFNEKRIRSMKKSAWLINVGRGAVVHEEALIGALKGRHIAGAMLDVYEHYRLEPDHPLLSLDNAILTPHLAGMTVESRARMSVAAAEEMLLMLAGKPPKNWVNRR
ncbi:MAG: D-3-phosphoglycerate dehydrogenase / 2-oxoglutarate reductase [Betaproteobacteria bacterium]|jgi:D-3-phosphoglycerate dehydrogenase|nr:D-3-phosphoglycerate dehydrogenase / 2-oxoglutarate reductase [Betaproteobacteria bacterium]